MSYPVPDGTQLIESLGRGSVFDVALVRDATKRICVCKRLTAKALRHEAGRSAIIREARLLSIAKHPSLPTLLRVGTDKFGPFLLQTRAVGISLRDIAKGWNAMPSKIPKHLVQHIAALTTQYLNEIQSIADDEGLLHIVHGDLGPDHILMSPTGNIRFVDFGAARWRSMDPKLQTEDRGTLPFVAPEIARGETPPTPEGDIYALAATLLFIAASEPICHKTDEAAMLVEIGEQGVRTELLDPIHAFDDDQKDALRKALSLSPNTRRDALLSLVTCFQ